MSEHQNLEVVRSVYAAFGRGDFEGILATLDPQVSWRTPGAPDLPTGGLRHGVPAVREFIGATLSLPMAYALGALLFGVQIADLAAFALTCALLVAVAVAAAFLPARRAARLDPVVALRTD